MAFSGESRYAPATLEEPKAASTCCIHDPLRTSPTTSIRRHCVCRNALLAIRHSSGAW